MPTRSAGPIRRPVGRAQGKPIIMAVIVLLGFALPTSALEFPPWQSNPPASQQKQSPGDAAHKTFQEGQQLQAQGTQESLRKAIEKYQETLALLRGQGDRAGEAVLLNDIGFVYSSLGEKQKALDYYQQALELLRALHDRAGEATALENIGQVYDDLGEQQKALDYYNQVLSLRHVLRDLDGEASALDDIGSAYAGLGQKQKALDAYGQALPLRHALGDRAGEAMTLSSIAGLYGDTGDKDKAVGNYNQALTILRAFGDGGGVATTLYNLGKLYDDTGEKQKALDAYNQALPVLRAAGDRAGEARMLSNIGRVYSDLDQRTKALDFYNQALALERAAGDRDGEATTLNNLGGVYDVLGEKAKALDYYQQALPLLREVGDHDVEAVALHNIGKLYDDLGEKSKALDYYQQALPLLHAAGDRGDEAVALNNLGQLYDGLGDEQKALDYYRQALPLVEAIGDRAGEALLLNNTGLAYDALGEKQKALDEYRQALPIWRAVGGLRGEAAALANLGIVYANLGENQKALEYFNQALPILRDAGDRAFEARTLSNLGEVYQDLGDLRKALDYFTQAVHLQQAVGDRSGEAVTLNNIGSLSDALGDRHTALDDFNRVLLLARQVGNRVAEAKALNNLGFEYDALGEKHKALDFFGQALPIARAVQDRSQQAATLSNVAGVERDLGNLSEARARMEAALTIVESLRTKVAGQELRASYVATVHGFYAAYIDILMRLDAQHPGEGYDGLALEASERGRARSLLEILSEGHADIRQGVDPALLDKERGLQQLLDGKSNRLTRLLLGEHTGEHASTAKKEIEDLQSQYQEVEAQIRSASPRYAALTQPQPATLKEIQQKILDTGTLLLEYGFGREHSYLWVVTQESLTTYTLPKAGEIEPLAKNLYASLTQPAGQTAEKEGRGFQAVQNPSGAGATRPLRQLAAQLSEMVLGPAATQLGRKRLVIVPDGALSYIPFGALPAPTSEKAEDGKQKPLVADHEIIYLPSASTVAMLRRDTAGRTPAAKLLAVMADPVFSPDDERVAAAEAAKTGAAQTGQVESRPASDRPAQDAGAELVQSQLSRSALDAGVTRGGGVPRLPFTRQEADAIASLVPPAERSEALGFAASKAAATSGKLGEYRLLHFATHGMLDSEHPELSGVVLSLVDAKGRAVDGFLRLQDIFNLNLPADLVVLSACETGLGKEIRGEGVVGLTRGFMYAGAPRVVVSLWSVNDQATAELMKRFYRGMLVEKLTPAAALRSAQMALAHDQRWKAPYYWAAFVLQGEWK